jgi:hypothetical protein
VLSSARCTEVMRSKARTLSDMKHSVGLAVVLTLAVLVACLFVGTNLFYNRGDVSDKALNISAPLDDTFIHLQYGSQIGEGEWFRYNDGDPVSTGASSFLYVLVLGAARLVGFAGPNLLGFAIVLGAGLFVLAAILGYELGRRLAGERAGFWSGALIAANGAYAWGATSGMEVALFSVMKDNRDKLRMASRRSPECGGNSASSSTGSLHLSPPGPGPYLCLPVPESER